MLGYSEWLVYLQDGSRSFVVCKGFTPKTRLVLQVVTGAGVGESVPFRGHATKDTPGQVRSLKVTVLKAPGGVALSWRPPVNAAQAGVTGYEYRVIGGAWMSTTTTSVNILNITTGRAATFAPSPARSGGQRLGRR